jgi:hypothetical protein
MRRSCLLMCLALSLGACASDPARDAEFKSETPLGDPLPAAAELVGVAIAPETGQRYVLDKHSGLYAVNGRATRLVFPTSDLVSRFGLSAQPDFTDVVALGSDRFAVTAENDGYMLDLHNGSFSSYFCYLPALDPAPGQQPPGVVIPPSVSQTLTAQGIPVKERTESVAYSPETLQLFAQPQTFRLDTGALAGSEIFTFNDSGGQPIAVRNVADPLFVAGGMSATPDQRLLMGMGNRIYVVTDSLGPTEIRILEAAIRIGGMARDTDGDLVLLDVAGRRLLEIAPL